MVIRSRFKEVLPMVPVIVAPVMVAPMARVVVERSAFDINGSSDDDESVLESEDQDDDAVGNYGFQEVVPV